MVTELMLESLLKKGKREFYVTLPDTKIKDISCLKQHKEVLKQKIRVDSLANNGFVYWTGITCGTGCKWLHCSGLSLNKEGDIVSIKGEKYI